jgi:hypothetical protein
MNSLFKVAMVAMTHIHNTGAFKKSNRLTFSSTPIFCSNSISRGPSLATGPGPFRLQTTSTATALLAGAVSGDRGHILATGKSWIGSPTFGGTENGVHFPYENGTFPYENGTFSYENVENVDVHRENECSPSDCPVFLDVPGLHFGKRMELYYMAHVETAT